MELLRAAVRSLVDPLMRLRTQRLAALIGAQVRDGDCVLDVGCGTMSVGRVISGKRPVRWVGVDTVDYHEPGLEFHKYSGGRLPFEAGRFDAVLLSFVLHHCDDPLAVLDDCLRVSKDRVIILEDTLRAGPLGLTLAKVHDWLANVLVQKDINMPYAFRSRAGWRRAFEERGLRLLHDEPLKSQPLAFVEQTLFVVAKGG